MFKGFSGQCTIIASIGPANRLPAPAPAAALAKELLYSVMTSKKSHRTRIMIFASCYMSKAAGISAGGLDAYYPDYSDLPVVLQSWSSHDRGRVCIVPKVTLLQQHLELKVFLK